MNTDVYHFNVGDFACMAVSDGSFTYEPPLIPPPADCLFANAKKELLTQALREHGIQPEQWLGFEDSFICVMVSAGQHKVLIDTGADGLTPNTEQLLCASSPTASTLWTSSGNPRRSPRS